MRVILSEGGIRGERREPGERNRRTKKGTVELGDGRTDGRRGAKPFAQKWNGMEGGRESGGPD